MIEKEGLIIRSTGSWYECLTLEKDIYSCRLKGKFKIQGLKVTNPIAVGDHVLFTVENEAIKNGIITEIKARKNYIIRQSVHKTAHGHLLAANIDQLVLIVTLASPKTSLGFIDRFLVTAETFRIPVLLVFNKFDLLKKSEIENQQKIMDMYENIGYQCIITSISDQKSVDHFQSKLQDKLSLIAGHSGVGKSSLINIIDPELELATSEISDFANKGVHTTTFAEMFEISDNTYIIDSPGIKELGLMEVEKEELAHYFPEFRRLLGMCKFHNCLHLNEPKCEVKESVMNGEIAESRYLSYISMFENHDNRR